MLYILSLLYGFGVNVRNRLYDLEILRSREAALPTISIGNLAVGGTGKTPHAEYILRLLGRQMPVAYVSRGYKRATTGMVHAGRGATAHDIGDEAAQVHSKFPDVEVVVDKHRARAIQYLARHTRAKAAVLDDAYQHRSLHPTLSVLLIDATGPLDRDHLLPYGRLREPFGRKDRADIIIATKCPDHFRPVDLMTIRRAIAPLAYQTLLFSRMKYAAPRRAKTGEQIAESRLKGQELLLLTGIERPEPLVAHLEQLGGRVLHIRHSDHHAYTRADLQEIEKQARRRILITTAKDLARLTAAPHVPEQIMNHLYVIEIEVEFLDDGAQRLDERIEQALRENSGKIRRKNLVAR